MNPLIELLDLLIENNHASSNYYTERRLREIRARAEDFLPRHPHVETAPPEQSDE